MLVPERTAEEASEGGKEYPSKVRRHQDKGYNDDKDMDEGGRIDQQI